MNWRTTAADQIAVAIATFVSQAGLLAPHFHMKSGTLVTLFPMKVGMRDWVG